MKQALLILTLFCIPTFAQAEKDQDPSNWNLTSALLRASPALGIAASGFVAMCKVPGHKKAIGIATVAALAGMNWFDPEPYSLITPVLSSIVYYVGPVYCVATFPYFGTCPCCPPGCMIIMNC
jgi:hypothetical protein